MAEVALAWVTDRPGVTATILGARTSSSCGPTSPRPTCTCPRRDRGLDAASDPHPPDYPYGELGVDQRDRTLGWSA
jgi:aryl-alcohol dehydrogenase (NADP+)